MRGNSSRTGEKTNQAEVKKLKREDECLNIHYLRSRDRFTA